MQSLEIVKKEKRIDGDDKIASSLSQKWGRTKGTVSAADITGLCSDTEGDDVKTRKDSEKKNWIYLFPVLF